MLLELLEGTLSVTDATHRIVLTLEIGSDRVANGLLILYQRNPLLV
jgi:hypothetical protein